MAMQGKIDARVAKFEAEASTLMEEGTELQKGVDETDGKVSKMTEAAEAQRVQILFKQYDTDMSGSLEETELAMLLADLPHSGVSRVGTNKIAEEYRGLVHDIFTSIDADGEGGVSARLCPRPRTPSIPHFAQFHRDLATSLALSEHLYQGFSIDVRNEARTEIYDVF